MNEIAILTCLSHYILFDDQDAFEQLRKQFRRMVYDIAEKYNVTNDQAIELEDLIQSGWVGFVRALKSYDPSYNTRLITHLHHWVHEAVTGAVRSMDDMGLRHKKHWLVQKVRRVYNEMYQQNGVNPTAEALAHRLGLRVSTVEDLLVASINTDKVSLDAVIDLANGTYDLHDVVPSDSMDMETVVELRLALEELTEHQRIVVDRHIFQGDTFEEIGDDYGTSKQAVQQTYERAVAGMRREMA